MFSLHSAYLHLCLPAGVVPAGRVTFYTCGASAGALSSITIGCSLPISSWTGRGKEIEERDDMTGSGDALPLHCDLCMIETWQASQTSEISVCFMWKTELRFAGDSVRVSN